ncbi:hypothetical protein D3C80_489080 [compost metagenome]
MDRIGQQLRADTQAHHVVTGIDGAVRGPFRRRLGRQAEAVAPAPHIVVTQRRRRPQLGRRGAVVVVQLQRTMPRRAFLDRQHHIQRPRRHARTQFRRHTPRRVLIQRHHIALEVRQVRRLARRQRWRLGAHGVGVLRPFDQHLADSLLGHLQHQDAALDRLLGNEDRDGDEAALFVGGLQRGARCLDVIGCPARPHEGIDRPFHHLGRQDGVALHLKGANLEAGRVLRRRGRGVNSQNSGQRQGARRASQRAMSLVIQHQSPVTRRPLRRPTPRTWSSGERHVRPTQAQRFSVKISRRFPVAYVLFRQATRTTSPGRRVARTP